VILDILALVALALAGLYAALTFLNAAALRPPAPPAPGAALPSVSVLIPARDEAANIGDALACVLKGHDIEMEVIVLDDASTDATAAIVHAIAAGDPRVRLISGKPLPPGWIGKQYACWQLARAARNPVLIFVDADVRLSAGAPARIANFLASRGLALASGFPRQRTETLAEVLVIPQILVLLLGYLPLPFARLSSGVGLAAGCGQLIAVDRDAYMAAGGHRAVAQTMHDGIKLPRTIRRHGGRTDLFDATSLATCRMYAGGAQVWAGFTKNATEGMATSAALPIWTVLLGGGHVLPWLLLPAALSSGNSFALQSVAAALAMLIAARATVAVVARQGALAVLLHPIGVVVMLAIQWSALINAGRGRPARWRGRVYDAG
jgi:hypothetical protein